jgi:hypothetical protein
MRDHGTDSAQAFEGCDDRRAPSIRLWTTGRGESDLTVAEVRGGAET